MDIPSHLWQGPLPVKEVMHILGLRGQLPTRSIEVVRDMGEPSVGAVFLRHPCSRLSKVSSSINRHESSGLGASSAIDRDNFPLREARVILLPGGYYSIN